MASLFRRLALATVLAALALPAAAQAAADPDKLFDVTAQAAGATSTGLTIQGSTYGVTGLTVSTTPDGSVSLVADDGASFNNFLPACTASGTALDDPTVVVQLVCVPSGAPAKLDYLEVFDYGDGPNSVELHAGVVKPSGVTALRLGAGDDTVMAVGADYPITADGEGGNDTLNGGDGVNLLDGGEGDDLLTGGAGADHLLGDAGHDELSGGAGVDTLDGGTGDDVVRARNGNNDIDAALVCGDDVEGGDHDVVVRDPADPAKPGDCEFEDPGFDGVPVIAGELTVGHALSVGGFTPFGDAAPLLVEWTACTTAPVSCDVVGNGNDPTYLLKAADAGRVISARLTLATPAAHGTGDYVAFAGDTAAVAAAPVVVVPVDPVDPVVVPPVSAPAVVSPPATPSPAPVTAAEQFHAAAHAAAAAAISGATALPHTLPANLMLFAPRALKSGVVNPGLKPTTGQFATLIESKSAPVLGIACQRSCTVTAALTVTYRGKVKGKVKSRSLKFKTQTIQVAAAGVGVVTLKPTKRQWPAFAKAGRPRLSMVLSIQVAGEPQATKTALLLRLKATTK